MKKLVLLLAVVFSTSLFSCGSSDKAAEATDTAVVEEVAVVEEAVVADSIAPDSVATDTVVAAAVAE